MTFKGGSHFGGAPCSRRPSTYQPNLDGEQLYLLEIISVPWCNQVESFQFHAFFKRVAQKIVRHTKWFHTCTISLMTSGFYSPATSDCVSFGLWCLKCFSKYFLSVTSYSQRVKVKQSKAKFYLS